MNIIPKPEGKNVNNKTCRSSGAEEYDYLLSTDMSLRWSEKLDQIFGRTLHLEGSVVGAHIGWVCVYKTR